MILAPLPNHTPAVFHGRPATAAEAWVSISRRRLLPARRGHATCYGCTPPPWSSVNSWLIELTICLGRRDVRREVWRLALARDACILGVGDDRRAVWTNRRRAARVAKAGLGRCGRGRQRYGGCGWDCGCEGSRVTDEGYGINVLHVSNVRNSDSVSGIPERPLSTSSWHLSRRLAHCFGSQPFGGFTGIGIGTCTSGRGVAAGLVCAHAACVIETPAASRSATIATRVGIASRSRALRFPFIAWLSPEPGFLDFARSGLRSE